MAVTLAPDDLAPFAAIDAEKAQAMIDDAIAMAAAEAPCITSDTFAFAAAAKAIIRGAVLRWHEAGSGARAEFHVGQVGQTYDTRQVRRGMFTKDEVASLRALCSATQGSVYSVSLAGPDPL